MHRRGICGSFAWSGVRPSRSKETEKKGGRIWFSRCFDILGAFHEKRAVGDKMEKGAPALLVFLGGSLFDLFGRKLSR
jgi:hypothetical protein